MKNVVIRPYSNSKISFDVLNFDGFIDIDDILALMAELNINRNTLTSTLFLAMTFTTYPT